MVKVEKAKGSDILPAVCVCATKQVFNTPDLAQPEENFGEDICWCWRFFLSQSQEEIFQCGDGRDGQGPKLV